MNKAMFGAFCKFVTDICKLHPSHTFLMGLGWGVDAGRSGRVTFLPGRKALIARGPNQSCPDEGHRTRGTPTATPPQSQLLCSHPWSFLAPSCLVFPDSSGSFLKVTEPAAFIWACTVCSQTSSQTLWLISGSTTWLLKDCLRPWRRYLSSSTVLTGKLSFSLCPPGFCECLNVRYIFGQILTF